MKKDTEKTCVERISAVMANNPVSPVPKGELWLGTDFLKQAGFADTLENHFCLVEQLDQDMVCLPITDNMTEKPMLGYRYFQCPELRQAVRISNRFVAAVIDGPFQSLVSQMGLMTVLKGWLRNQQDMIKAYETEKEKTLDLISRCLDQGAHAIVITDDLAAGQGPLMSPGDIDRLCTPFYIKAVNNIQKAAAVAFLHSCGNITRLTNLIKTWNLDGLAAVQHSANNLLTLRDALGSNGVIMAGIDAELLVSDTPPADALSEFKRILDALGPTGGLILSSACGLYEGSFLKRIEKLYSIADQRSKF